MIPLAAGILSRSITAETTQLYQCYATGVPFEVAYVYTHSIKHRTGGWKETDSNRKLVRWEGTRSLFGAHLWDDTPRPVYLCEGETDAMRLSQYIPHSYCLALGGNPATAELPTILETLRTFAGSHPVTLCFDADPSGVEYTRKFAKLLGSQVTQVLKLPTGIKDICQLDSTAEPEFEPWPKLPHNITSGTEVLKHMKLGSDGKIQRDYVSTGYASLDHLIGGWSKGGMVMFAGHPKHGKSSFVNDLTRRYIYANSDSKVLVVPLEMTQEDTLGCIGGDDLPYIAERTYFLRHFGMLTATEMADYLAVIPHLGITHVVVDHITAACTSPVDGLLTGLLDSLLYTMQAAISEYQVSMAVVTHVSMRAADDGTITKKDLRGTYGLAQVPLAVLGVQKQEAGLSRIYTITCDRFVGRDGSIYLDYDQDTRTYKEQTNGLI